LRRLPLAEDQYGVCGFRLPVSRLRAGLAWLGPQERVRTACLPSWFPRTRLERSRLRPTLPKLPQRRNKCGIEGLRPARQWPEGQRRAKGHVKSRPVTLAVPIRSVRISSLCGVVARRPTRAVRPVAKPSERSGPGDELRPGDRRSLHATHRSLEAFVSKQ